MNVFKIDWLCAKKKFRKNFNKIQMERMSNEKRHLLFVKDDEELKNEKINQKKFKEFHIEDSVANLNFDSSEIYKDLRVLKSYNLQFI